MKTNKRKNPELKTSKSEGLNEKKDLKKCKSAKLSVTTCRRSSKKMEKKINSNFSLHQKNIFLPIEKQNFSTNWKNLLNSLPNKNYSSSTEKKKKISSSSTTTTNESNSNQNQFKKDTKKYNNNNNNNKYAKNEVWFDGVDEILIETKNNKKSKNFDFKPKPNTINFIQNEKINFTKRITEYISLDCEMVGIGIDGKDNMLARVSLVNQFGNCIYDKFVKPRESVIDYRTPVSGITPENLKKGTDFSIVQKEVSDLIKGKILVGHAVNNDLKVLFLDHSHKNIRDTSRYKPFQKLFGGKTPSLKNLTKKFLGIEIQQGSHNSIIDAQATMKIFMKHRKEWENQFRKSKKKIGKKKIKLNL